MYKHTNSASRLHTLLRTAQQQPDIATYQVWSTVFEVQEKDEQKKAEFVLSHLHWLHLEVEILEQQVKTKGLSPHLYDGAFSRIRQIISPLNLAAGWQGYKGNLTPDVLLALAFLNELLPDEESGIDELELNEILSQVQELAELLRHSTLPDRLQKLVAHHLNLIREAISRYPVSGAKALREAGRAALGEIVEVKDAISKSQSSPEIQALGKLWRRVNSTADTALKAEQVYQLGTKAWDALLTWIQN